MRTTIDLPDNLFRQVKSQAALRGETLKDFVQTAIERAVVAEAPAGSFQVKLPLIKSKKTHTLSLTNAEIENLLA